MQWNYLITLHLDAFKPLSRLQSIELFFNPKLFQPGFESCVPPITVSFSVFKVSSILHNLGKGQIILRYFNYLILIH